MTSETCGHVPFPGSGGYGHWSCQRSRLHSGAHRFNNYTTPRIPRVWDVKQLTRYWWAHRKWNRRTGHWPESMPLALSYWSVLHRAKFRPIPTDHLEIKKGA